MRLKQQIGQPRGLDLFWGLAGKSRLRVAAGVGIGPTIKSPGFRPDLEIGHELVAHAVALLDDGPKRAGFRIDGETTRIAHACDVRCLPAAVGLEALDGRLDLRLDADVADRANADEECPGF